MRSQLILVDLGDFGDMGYLGNLEAENELPFWVEVEGDGSSPISSMH